MTALALSVALFVAAQSWTVDTDYHIGSFYYDNYIEDEYIGLTYDMLSVLATEWIDDELWDDINTITTTDNNFIIQKCLERLTDYFCGCQSFDIYNNLMIYQCHSSKAEIYNGHKQYYDADTQYYMYNMGDNYMDELDEPFSEGDEVIIGGDHKYCRSDGKIKSGSTSEGWKVAISSGQNVLVQEEDLIHKKDINKFRPNDFAKIHGLTSTEGVKLNGKICRVMDWFNAAQKRWPVDLGPFFGDKQELLKTKNLVKFTPKVGAFKVSDRVKITGYPKENENFKYNGKEGVVMKQRFNNPNQMVVVITTTSGTQTPTSIHVTSEKYLEKIEKPKLEKSSEEEPNYLGFDSSSEEEQPSTSHHFFSFGSSRVAPNAIKQDFEATWKEIKAFTGHQDFADIFKNGGLDDDEKPGFEGKWGKYTRAKSPGGLTKTELLVLYFYINNSDFAYLYHKYYRDVTIPRERAARIAAAMWDLLHKEERKKTFAEWTQAYDEWWEKKKKKKNINDKGQTKMFYHGTKADISIIAKSLEAFDARKRKTIKQLEANKSPLLQKVLAKEMKSRQLVFGGMSWSTSDGVAGTFGPSILVLTKQSLGLALKDTDYQDKMGYFGGRALQIVAIYKHEEEHILSDIDISMFGEIGQIDYKMGFRRPKNVWMEVEKYKKQPSVLMLPSHYAGEYDPVLSNNEEYRNMPLSKLK